MVLNIGLPISETTVWRRLLYRNGKIMMFLQIRYTLTWLQKHPVLWQLFSTVQKSQPEIQSQGQTPGQAMRPTYVSSMKNNNNKNPVIISTVILLSNPNPWEDAWHVFILWRLVLLPSRFTVTKMESLTTGIIALLQFKSGHQILHLLIPDFSLVYMMF